MISETLSFFIPIWQKRRLVLLMARREVVSQYVGSGLGSLWMLIQPVVMITVFWFVFSMGFKVKPTNDVPFVVWLTAGLAPWFLFSAIVNGSAAVVVHHSHLIKKTIFFSQLLPVVKIFSSLVAHAVFLVILFCLIVLQGIAVNIWFLQVLYYLFCLVVLSLGISWLFSALYVFLRDIGQIVGVMLQVGFWLTPVFWDIEMMPPRIQLLLKLNPVYYIIQGYRDSFLAGMPFWHRPVYSLYFWLFAVCLFCLGAFVFNRMKPQFSDVL
ncbi:MAG: ABC transporter permease [Desulfobulbaceae bacterium]|nr:MAG: ABC transporter permease [Desulfobulbaceae bacterium]